MNRTAESATTGLDDTLLQARDGAVVVTASRRLARLLCDRYNTAAAEEGSEAWPAPKILPWPAWMGELWEAVLYSGGADPVPVRIGEHPGYAVWERIIAASPEADGLLQLAATAEAAAEAWALMHAWRLDRASIEAEASEDTLAFLRWACKFESACGQENWIDDARLPDYLAAVLPRLPLPSRIVLAGFDELTPQQREFVEAIRGAGVDVFVAETPEPAAAAGAVRVAFTDRAAEIAAAARWARDLLEQGETSIGIVVHGLSEQRVNVERIFSQVPASGLPGTGSRPPLFNISAGPALSSYPVVHAALRALELKPAASDAGLVSRLLLSPFLGGAEAEWTGRAALDANLRRFGGAEVSVPAIERLCPRHKCPALAKALRAWRRERDAVPAHQRPADWARTFSVLLARLGWPGGRDLSSDEYQTVQAWRELLSDFAGLETVLDLATYDDALGRLRRMADARMFQPETEPAPIQILGMLDTAGLCFDHLWVAGLDDESWPGPPKPAAFLPAAFQRARQIPHASPERELTFARMITERLLGSAENVIVSYACREQDRELGPSPLIRQIPAEELAIPDYRLYSDVVRAASLLETIEDHSAPPVEDGAASGGTRVFRYQAMCPFRAFAELRLGAEPLEAPAPGLSPMERGILVHEALANIWTELRSHARLCAAAPEELSGLIRTAVREAVDALAETRADTLPERFAAIEASRLERLLGEWLEAEKVRRPFTVVAIESERQAEAGGIRCKVKVDRVDRLDDGRDVIIDYKTGSPALRSWTGDRPDDPQLPLYAITHDGPVAAVLFGQLKTGEIGFKGYADGQGIAPRAETIDVAAQIEEWRGVLDRLGADFRAGVANVNPKDAIACRRCSLLALCRFGEAETPASAFDGDGNHA